MPDALIAHRWHFGFTILFHYLFPVLTMGLGVLIAVLKTLQIAKGADVYGRAARFWAKIFAITFAAGVVTGIPMEFQFGTNWARFSHFAGGVVGQTLFMEGVFAFFAESSFLGLFLFGEKRVSPAHALVVGGHGCPRRRRVGVLHRRHQCLDAAPGGLRGGGRAGAADQPLGAAHQPVRSSGSSRTSSAGR